MTTSSGFPLLKLPLLALETVTCQMDPWVIFYLLFSYKTFKSLLLALKWCINSLEWILFESQILIKIHSKSQALNIEILSDYTHGSEPKKMKGLTVALAKHECPKTVTSWFLGPGKSENWENLDTKLKVLENFTEFLMSFVKCSSFKLHFALEENLTRHFFLWKYFKEKSIDLRIAGAHGNTLKMASRDLKFLLEDVKSDNLNLNIQVTDPNFKYQGKLDAKELSISSNNWLDYRNSGINCEKIYSSFGSQNSDDFNQVLKIWIQGVSLEKLEYLDMYKRGSINAADVLKDIKNQKTKFSDSDFKLRMGFYEENAVYRDIQRESDDRWGTVVVDSRYFYFLVWKLENLKHCCKETRIKFGLE